MTEDLPTVDQICDARIALYVALDASTIIIGAEPYLPGGTADHWRRTVVEKMQEAAGKLGLELVKRSTADHVGPR